MKRFHGLKYFFDQKRILINTFLFNRHTHYLIDDIPYLSFAAFNVIVLDSTYNDDAKSLK